MPEAAPRYPLKVGDRVVHIGRSGIGEIDELLAVAGLPGARVRWTEGGEERLPLGYLCHARTEDL